MRTVKSMVSPSMRSRHSDAEARARLLLYERLGYKALVEYVDYKRVTVTGGGRTWTVGAEHAVADDMYGHHHYCVYAIPDAAGLPKADRVLSMAIQARSNSRYFEHRAKIIGCGGFCPLGVR